MAPDFGLGASTDWEVLPRLHCIQSLGGALINRILGSPLARVTAKQPAEGYSGAQGFSGSPLRSPVVYGRLDADGLPNNASGLALGGLVAGTSFGLQSSCPLVACASISTGTWVSVVRYSCCDSHSLLVFSNLCTNP